ncbi:hypothetical protein F511_41953 [Dorcoceras hygrometricum]|uniref:Uncharacterized protein n=1 Tax=Dorcoceras hygrometricum TaxID=472368 RepID=A0A2Z7AZ71_9LAMI|nr:hypothetical protein F511_41953 [Dorcoceras hygrometricum]
MKKKSGSSKENLEIVVVAQEAVPIQIIEPIHAAPVVEPSVEEQREATSAVLIDEDISAEKGKKPLHEKDPVKGNPVEEQVFLILADIECLVQLLENIIDDDRFFNSFSFKKLASLKVEDISAKEELVLSWGEAESTRVALNRRMYILLKYRELLLRKFLEARKINFAPGDGSSTVDLKVLDRLSDIHSFVLEELKEQAKAHGLMCKKT